MWGRLLLRVGTIVAVGASLMAAGCGGTNTVSGAVKMSVSGGTPALRLNDSRQFNASFSGGPAARVVWSVSGLPGGDDRVGRISDAGLYTAPPVLPALGSVIIRATSARDASILAETTQKLWNPVPSISNVASLEDASRVTLDIFGANFVPGARLSYGGRIYSADAASATELKASVPSLPPGTASVLVSVINPEPGAAQSADFTLIIDRAQRPARGSVAQPEARFLEQATFGPTAASIARVRQIGMSAWLDEQMNSALTPKSQWPSVPNPLPTQCSNNNGMLCVQQEWFQNALVGQDQLRQRVAFALSQIWVISGTTITTPGAWATTNANTSAYLNILTNDGFGNFRTMMQDITLSPGMGWYLDMGNSDKPANGQIANENYARELMQLFTIGLYQLNQDGTLALDGNGQPVATYSQDDIQQFAKALTGWTFVRCCGGSQSFPTNIGLADFAQPGSNAAGSMVAFETHHDTSQKTLLNGTVLAPGQTASQDLQSALDNLFNHANAGPFISKQLIQRLVTSNPSPAYVWRVAGVFNDNGAGVRGDLKAVVRAILLDPEARADDNLPYSNRDAAGHLREPVLMMTGILRGLGFSCTSGCAAPSAAGITNWGVGLPGAGSNMAQNVLFSPTVFNYFPPDYVINGTNLLGPEFNIQTTATTLIRTNWVDQVARCGGAAAPCTALGGANNMSIDVTAYSSLAGSPDRMVDLMEANFVRGQLSAGVKQSVISTVSAMPNSTNNDALLRARTALYLVLSSSQYQVAH